MKPASGKELKERGQQIALDNTGHDWTAGMSEKLKAFIKVRRDLGMDTFKMEEFRAVALICQWPAPKSSNTWGAFTTAVCNAGLIVWTEKYETAKSAATHGHPVKVWRGA